MRVGNRLPKLAADGMTMSFLRYLLLLFNYFLRIFLDREHNY